MNIEHQKEQLLTIKQEIEKELNALGRKVSDDGDWIAVPDEDDGNHADPIDNADHVEDYEEKIAVLKVLEERYRYVARALSAIDDGSYGICLVCKKPISQNRLAANPSSTTCIQH